MVSTSHGEPGLVRDEFITVAVLVFLRARLSNECDRWEGMESKANAWLSSQGMDKQIYEEMVTKTLMCL